MSAQIDYQVPAADLFSGKKVRLTRDQPDAAAKAWFRWQQNSVMKRMLADAPSMLFSLSATNRFTQESIKGDPHDVFFFHVHKLEDDSLIGFVELRAAGGPNGDSWVGMTIGDSANWNQGYGTEALKMLVRYGFDELNLHRISLDVFSYNLRAMRAYEKVGFRVEGIERRAIRREGQRFDVYTMGILRVEWEQMQSFAAQA